MNLSDVEFLTWLKYRLINVYKESPNVDFIHRLERIIDSLNETTKE